MSKKVRGDRVSRHEAAWPASLLCSAAREDTGEWRFHLATVECEYPKLWSMP
jgi:hypothetical protein